MKGAALVALALLVAAGCGPDHPRTPQGRWDARCARCHEADGSSLTASEQAGRPVDLRTARFQTEYTDLRIRHIMVHGEGKMQGISGITDAEVDSILLFVRSFTPQGPRLLDTGPPTP